MKRCITWHVDIKLRPKSAPARDFKYEGTYILATDGTVLIPNAVIHCLTDCIPVPPGLFAGPVDPCWECKGAIHPSASSTFQSHCAALLISSDKWDY